MVEELKSMVGLEETILYEGKPDKKCFIFESIFNPLMVILIFSTSQYQFLPCLYILQFLSNILFLQYSTTSAVSIFRFLLILSIPISVVWILSILSSNIFLSSIFSFPQPSYSVKSKSIDFTGFDDFYLPQKQSRKWWIS